MPKNIGCLFPFCACALTRLGCAAEPKEDFGPWQAKAKQENTSEWPIEGYDFSDEAFGG